MQELLISCPQYLCIDENHANFRNAHMGNPEVKRLPQDQKDALNDYCISERLIKHHASTPKFDHDRETDHGKTGPPVEIIDQEADQGDLYS